MKKNNLRKTKIFTMGKDRYGIYVRDKQTVKYGNLSFKLQAGGFAAFTKQMLTDGISSNGKKGRPDKQCSC